MARKADFFLFQTESSRTGFCKRLKVSQTKTEVISNAIDTPAFKRIKEEKSWNPKQKTIILCPAAPHQHKALELIPDYAKVLKDMGYANFSFELTISEDHPIFRRIGKKNKRLGVSNMLTTRGAYSYKDVGDIYEDCDIVFVPSLLETFSATYLEAFIAQKPLIVSDREFAKEVCGQAAMYVEPLNTTNVADNLVKISNDPVLRAQMVRTGLDRLDFFGDQGSRVENILQKIMILLK